MRVLLSDRSELQPRPQSEVIDYRLTLTPIFVSSDASRPLKSPSDENQALISYIWEPDKNVFLQKFCNQPVGDSCQNQTFSNRTMVGYIFYIYFRYSNFARTTQPLDLHAQLGQYTVVVID